MATVGKILMPIGKGETGQKSSSLIKNIREKLFLLMPVFAVLFFAIVIAYISDILNIPRIPVVPFAKEKEIKAILFNTLFFVFLVSFGLVFVYMTLKKGRVAILEKMFGIGGGFLTLAFGAIISLLVSQQHPSFTILLLLSLYIIIVSLSIIFLLFGILSEETRNLIYMVYSAVVGSFLGMGIPTFSMTCILLSICIIDLISYRTGFLKRLVDLSEGKTIFFRVKYAKKELFIGWADLVYYSTFASYTFTNFGTLTAAFSVLLIAIGCVITFFFTSKREIFAGLPIPVVLGLMPVLLNLNPAYLLFLAAPLGIDQLIMLLKPRMSKKLKRLEESRIILWILKGRETVKVPRYPRIRLSLGLANLLTAFVVTPLVLAPLITLLSIDLHLTIQNWLIVSFIAYEILFTHLAFTPLVYTGILNGAYLLISRNVRRIFAISLFLCYLLLTTLIIPFQYYLLEIFRSIIYIAPLYIIVTFSLIYSAVEPSIPMQKIKDI